MGPIFQLHDAKILSGHNSVSSRAQIRCCVLWNDAFNRSTLSPIPCVLRLCKNWYFYQKYFHPIMTILLRLFQIAYRSFLALVKGVKGLGRRQMLNRKSTNTPLLRLIFACTLSLKRLFNVFLEAQLRSSKGVFVLFLLNIWVQFHTA